MWERFKVLKMKPHEWISDGELIEEHLNAIIEMTKLHNKKMQMDQELAQRKAASKNGTSVSKGF